MIRGIGKIGNGFKGIVCKNLGGNGGSRGIIREGGNNKNGECNAENGGKFCK